MGKRKKTGVVPLLRKSDGTVYAYRCLDCQAAWKVYQKAQHNVGCTTFGEPTAADQARVRRETKEELKKSGIRRR